MVFILTIILVVLLMQVGVYLSSTSEENHLRYVLLKEVVEVINDRDMTIPALLLLEYITASVIDKIFYKE